MWYDLVILAILAWATIRGAVKGFVWQLATIRRHRLVLRLFRDGFAGGCAVHRRRAAAEPLGLDVRAVRRLLVRGVRGRQKTVRVDREGPLRRIRPALGAPFGFLKGTVFCLVLTFFVVTLSAEGEDACAALRSGHRFGDRHGPVASRDAGSEPPRRARNRYIHQLDQPGQDLKAHPNGRPRGPAKAITSICTSTTIRSAIRSGRSALARSTMDAHQRRSVRRQRRGDG